MKLLGIICMSKINHNSAYYHNCLTDNLHLTKGKSYYYDGLPNLGETQLIDKPNFKEKISFISKYNPFVIIYNKKIYNLNFDYHIYIFIFLFKIFTKYFNYKL